MSSDYLEDTVRITVAWIWFKTKTSKAAKQET